MGEAKRRQKQDPGWGKHRDELRGMSGKAKKIFTIMAMKSLRHSEPGVITKTSVGNGMCGIEFFKLEDIDRSISQNPDYIRIVSEIDFQTHRLFVWQEQAKTHVLALPLDKIQNIASQESFSSAFADFGT
jgi:hypothetical protein